MRRATVFLPAALILAAPPLPLASLASRCEETEEVCGVMDHAELKPFANRCEAVVAGAKRVLVGPCIDDD